MDDDSFLRTALSTVGLACPALILDVLVGQSPIDVLRANLALIENGGSACRVLERLAKTYAHNATARRKVLDTLTPLEAYSDVTATLDKVAAAAGELVHPASEARALLETLNKPKLLPLIEKQLRAPGVTAEDSIMLLVFAWTRAHGGVGVTLKCAGYPLNAALTGPYRAEAEDPEGWAKLKEYEKKLTARGRKRPAPEEETTATPPADGAPPRKRGAPLIINSTLGAADFSGIDEAQLAAAGFRLYRGTDARAAPVLVSPQFNVLLTPFKAPVEQQQLVRCVLQALRQALGTDIVFPAATITRLTFSHPTRDKTSGGWQTTPVQRGGSSHRRSLASQPQETLFTRGMTSTTQKRSLFVVETNPDMNTNEAPRSINSVLHHYLSKCGLLDAEEGPATIEQHVAYSRWRVMIQAATVALVLDALGAASTDDLDDHIVVLPTRDTTDLAVVGIDHVGGSVSLTGNRFVRSILHNPALRAFVARDFLSAMRHIVGSLTAGAIMDKVEPMRAYVNYVRGRVATIRDRHLSVVEEDEERQDE